MRYATHESAEIICMSYALNDMEPALWIWGDPFPKHFFNWIDKRYPVAAWNAAFERVWFKYCGERKLFWPSIPDELWLDPQAMAASLALPLELEKCAIALGVEEQKDKRGKHLINKLTKPRKPSKKNPDTRWTPQNTPQDFADFYEYCRQDVRTERAIYHALPIKDLPPIEKKTWYITIKQNENGIPIDTTGLKNILNVISWDTKQKEKQISQLTNGDVTTGGQRDRIVKFIKDKGIDIPDLTKPTVEYYLQVPIKEDGGIGIPQCVHDILKLRQSLSKTSTKKFVKLANQALHGRICDILQYHAATTGRFGGRNFQIQNLPRLSLSDPYLAFDLIDRFPPATVQLFYDDLIEMASAMIRPTIMASPGKILRVCDFKSIENVVLLWFAHDWQALERFVQGYSQYIDMSAYLYKRRYDQIKKGTEVYKIGKVIILGCGYGMGWKTFISHCDQRGVKINKKQAKDAVDAFRAKYERVAMLWDKLYEAAKYAIRSKSETEYHGVRFNCDNDFMTMRLPSGRLLSYYEPKLERKLAPWGKYTWQITHMGLTSKNQWVRLKMIPGRLTENLVQATARDLLIEAQIRTIDAGYNVLGSVHDELISEDDKDFGSFDEFKQIMCDYDESIYPDLPLMADGYEATRYRKD